MKETIEKYISRIMEYPLALLETKKSMKISKGNSITAEEKELNEKVITPAIIIDYRIKIIENMITENEYIYSKEEGKRTKLIGISAQATKIIWILGLCTKNIEILNKEKAKLIREQTEYMESYKKYLKINDIPKDSK